MEYTLHVNGGERFCWVTLVGGNGEIVLTGEALNQRSSAVEIARNIAAGSVTYPEDNQEAP